jgi:hypothetical protein
MSNLTVSSVILREIGRIAVLQAHIEQSLAVVVMNLADVPEATGHGLTKAMSFRTIVEVVKSLTAVRLPSDDPDAAHLVKVLKDASALAEERNKIVHSMWAFGADFGPSTATRTKVGHSSTEATAVTLTELQTLAEETEAVLAKLVYLHPRLRRPA